MIFLFIYFFIYAHYVTLDSGKHIIALSIIATLMSIFWQHVPVLFSVSYALEHYSAL